MLFPKIITISGVDGSGKTTISNLLKKDLEEKGYKVYIYHSGALVKTSSEPKYKMSFAVGFTAFIKDYLQIIIQYLTSLGFYDYLIFDRFLYDSIVKISYKQGLAHVPMFYVFLAKVFFPLRHISFLLMTSSSVSWTRDQEHSQKYHRNKFALYKTLPRFFSFKIIDCEKPLSEVVEQVKRYI